MRKFFAFFFAMALLLAGCSQQDSAENSDMKVTLTTDSSTEDVAQESDVADADAELGQPFVIEDCVPILKEFSNGNRYDFNCTVRNNSGKSIDNPALDIDFLDENKDILWSSTLYHNGTVKNGQSFAYAVSLNDTDFEFQFVDEFAYISIANYEGDDDFLPITIANPQYFSIS